MSEKDILKHAKLIAKQDKVGNPTIVNVGAKGVMIAFENNDSLYPPCWFRYFTFIELSKKRGDKD